MTTTYERKVIGCSLSDSVQTLLLPNFPSIVPRPSYPSLKNVSFSFCNLSAAAELALDPKWSLVVSTRTPCSLGIKIAPDSNPSAPADEGKRAEIGRDGGNSGRLSLEGRRYFDVDGSDRRGFVSARFGTSKNLGLALGLAFSDKHKEHGGLSVHVGGYLNLTRPWEIKPTLGLSLAWSSF